MHQVYAPVRKPSFLHGVARERIADSRPPAAWEAHDSRPQWARVSADRLFGRTGWQGRISRAERAGARAQRRRPHTAETAGRRPSAEVPSLQLSQLRATAAARAEEQDAEPQERPRSSRVWDTAGWSPPPRRIKRASGAAPLRLSEVQASKSFSDARALRQFEEQMAGWGPYPSAVVARQRLRRGHATIDRQLRQRSIEAEIQQVCELATPRVAKATRAELEDAEKRKKRAQKRNERRKTLGAALDFGAVAGGEKTTAKTLLSGAVIDPQEHIARPSPASPYKDAVMPEHHVSTVNIPDLPPRKMTRGDGSTVLTHSGSRKFGGVDAASGLVLSKLFEQVQRADEEDVGLAALGRPTTPGGSVIGPTITARQRVEPGPNGAPQEEQAQFVHDLRPHSSCVSSRF
jgi:hypothetical protein